MRFFFDILYLGGSQNSTQFIYSIFFLFWICSTKYSLALHSHFHIFEKAQKIQHLTQWLTSKIQCVRTKFERAHKRQYCTQQFLCV